MLNTLNILRTTVLMALLVSFTACGGGADQDQTADAPADAMTETPSGATTEGEQDTTPAERTVTDGEILIQPVGNQLLFDVTSFTVDAGEEVTIVFENTAELEALQHNVVVLNSNDDSVVNRVGQAALAAGPSAEYIPEDDAILAHTALAGPGETVEVTFTAPSEPGEYRYICTFPGHYLVMQGTMTVE